MNHKQKHTIKCFRRTACILRVVNMLCAHGLTHKVGPGPRFSDPTKRPGFWVPLFAYAIKNVIPLIFKRKDVLKPNRKKSKKENKYTLDQLF